jgi:ABC-type uncharacterized transport system permease subunit
VKPSCRTKVSRRHLLAIFGGSFIYWYIIQILMKLMDYIPGGSNYLTLWKALLLVLGLSHPLSRSSKRKNTMRPQKGGR